MPCCAIIHVADVEVRGDELCCFCGLINGEWYVTASDTVSCVMTGPVCHEDFPWWSCAGKSWRLTFNASGPMSTDPFFIRVELLDSTGFAIATYESADIAANTNCCSLGLRTVFWVSGATCDFPPEMQVEFLQRPFSQCPDLHECTEELGTCSCCNCGTTPFYVEVSIEDFWYFKSCIELDGPPFDQCTQAVGDFVLALENPGGAICTWKYDFPQAGCYPDANSCCWRTLTFTLSCGGGTTTGTVSLNSDNNGITWRKTWAGNKIDCMFTDTVFQHCTETTFGTNCTWDGNKFTTSCGVTTKRFVTVRSCSFDGITATCPP